MLCCNQDYFIYLLHTPSGIFFLSRKKWPSQSHFWLSQRFLPCLTVSEMAPSFFNRVSKSPVYYKLPQRVVWVLPCCCPVYIFWKSLCFIQAETTDNLCQSVIQKCQLIWRFKSQTWSDYSFRKSPPLSKFAFNGSPVAFNGHTEYIWKRLYR